MIHSGALNSCHLVQEKGNEELCGQQISCVKGLSSALILSFEMSTHVDYSVYFYPMLGPSRLKSSLKLLDEDLADSSYTSSDVLP